MNAAVVMDGTSADVCKEQRLLEEDQLLDIGSVESEANDVDAIVMDIDDDDDMPLSTLSNATSTSSPSSS